MLPNLKNTTADELTFKRKEKDFRCLDGQTPNIDFAFILTRQFLIDCYHQTLFNQLVNSQDERISGISKKAIKEINYHLKHRMDFKIRFGD